MKYVANFLRYPYKFFKDESYQRILILSVFVIAFLCLLVMLANGRSRSGEAAINVDATAAISTPMTPTLTSTKWWIKMTVTSSLIPSTPVVSTASSGSLTKDCGKKFSSPFSPGIHAYISLNPPLPNRIRSHASLSSNYVGEIEPGGGLKVIDGPICADGYSWWLVEALHGDLRGGWTVEGNNSEQWVVPCPNERTACSQIAMATSSVIATKTEDNKNENNCKSDKLAVGVLAQVGKDSLLVLRSEPYAGEVNGRAGSMSIVKVTGGPTCVGGAVWWKVNVLDLDLVGWATENDLYACPKDSECNLGPS